VKPIDHLGEGAVQRGHFLIRKPIRYFKHRLSGRQMIILGIGADEVWMIVRGIGNQPGLSLRAGRPVTGKAGPAFLAGSEVLVDHTVTNSQRLPLGIG
jgi:hypothetical protein